MKSKDVINIFASKNRSGNKCLNLSIDPFEVFSSIGYTIFTFKSLSNL